MSNSALLERQLPYGVADLFLEEAAFKSEIEATLKQTFAGWSYSEIIPPTFEYYESLAAEASPQVREEIYRFFDRDGRMLALRADPTIPVARIVGTKLYDRQLPLRFFYVSNVFRYEEPKAALRREFTQAGVELIGAASPAADAEVIALAVAALRAIGLGDFRVRIGSTAFVRALLDELELSPPELENLKLALERKSSSALSELLRDRRIQPDLMAALDCLPQLTGDASVLELAQHRCGANLPAQDAIEWLREMHRLLAALGCADALTFDLAMVRGMAYYTGVVFEAFASGIGFSIMSGGRYDNLLAHFGRNLPALGFAIGVERALAALKLRGVRPPDLHPHIVAEMPDSTQVAERVQNARSQGRRVEFYVSRGTPEATISFARAHGAREVWFADGTVELLT